MQKHTWLDLLDHTRKSSPELPTRIKILIIYMQYEPLSKQEIVCSYKSNFINILILECQNKSPL